MLTKIVLLIAILLLGNQLLSWLMLIDTIVLREVMTSILIALILQPFVLQQFR